MSPLGVINAKAGPHRDAQVAWLRIESEQAHRAIERLLDLMAQARTKRRGGAP